MRKIVIAACAALACTAAAAQSKKELIAKVLQLSHPNVEQLTRQIVEQPTQQLLQRASPAVARLPADKREAVARQLQAEAKAFVDEAAPLLRDRAVKLLPETVGAQLEAKFNEQELKTLIAWQESPVSRKYQEMSPQMHRELLQRLANDARPTLEPKLQALGDSFAKKLNLNQPLGAPQPAPAPASAPASGPR